ncbi:MAG TPA: hypothetical protein VFQ53_01670 [Kofleriaceae bacterium]|nr:hypothetical protein [Kofleriaceae bacterium]
MTAPDASPQDVAAFEDALPAAVRAALEAGATGQGIAAGWVRALDGPSQVAAAVALVQGSVGDPTVIGWLAGMTMFVDYHRAIAISIQRGHRVDLLPHVIDAFAAGARRELAMPKKLWLSIETLALLLPALPDPLVAALPYALMSNYDPTHEIGMRLAVLAGARAVHAITAARAAPMTNHGSILAVHARSRLDRALAMLATPAPASSTLDSLLRRLLDAWRATRDPALEPAIVDLGAELAHVRGPLRVPADDDREWLLVAARDDPADTDRLLDCPWPAGVAVRARFEALVRRSADPRYARVEAIAAAYRDDRDPVWSDPAVEAAVKRLATRVPATGAADPALCAEADAALVPVRRRVLLLDAYLANPDDEAALAVLADALVEAGDPRGELIALETAIANGTASSKAAERAPTLLYEHRDRWLEPLPDVGRAQFERGFPVSLVCEPRVDGRLAAAVEHREWATLRELVVAVPHLDLTPLVRRMPRLRLLVNTWREPLEQLATSGEVFPALRTIGSFDHWVPRTLAAFPQLAVVGGQLSPSEAHTEDALRAAARIDLPVLVFLNVRPYQLAAITTRRHAGPRLVRITDGYGFYSTTWALELPATGDRGQLWCTGGHIQRSELQVLIDALRAGGLRRLSLRIGGGPDVERRVVEDLRSVAHGFALAVDAPAIDLAAPPV